MPNVTPKPMSSAVRSVNGRAVLRGSTTGSYVTAAAEPGGAHAFRRTNTGMTGWAGSPIVGYVGGMNPQSLVVFSDLDDTLLNAVAWCTDEPAPGPIVDRAGRCVPLVLCSRRTRAELERIQQQLGFRHPFI